MRRVIENKISVIKNGIMSAGDPEVVARGSRSSFWASAPPWPTSFLEVGKPGWSTQSSRPASQNSGNEYNLELSGMTLNRPPTRPPPTSLIHNIASEGKTGTRNLLGIWIFFNFQHEKRWKVRGIRQNEALAILVMVFLQKLGQWNCACRLFFHFSQQVFPCHYLAIRCPLAALCFQEWRIPW